MCLNFIGAITTISFESGQYCSIFSFNVFIIFSILLLSILITSSFSFPPRKVLILSAESSKAFIVLSSFAIKELLICLAREILILSSNSSLFVSSAKSFIFSKIYTISFMETFSFIRFVRIYFNSATER